MQIVEETGYVSIEEIGRIAFHPESGIFAVLTMQHDRPLLRHATTLVGNEISFMITLLSHYPKLAPREEFVCTFRGTEGDLALARCKKELDAANRVATDRIMRPIRSTFHRMRKKLEPMGLTVDTVYETGFMLGLGEENGTRKTLSRRAP